MLDAQAEERLKAGCSVVIGGSGGRDHALRPPEVAAVAYRSGRIAGVWSVRPESVHFVEPRPYGPKYARCLGTRQTPGRSLPDCLDQRRFKTDLRAVTD